MGGRWKIGLNFPLSRMAKGAPEEVAPNEKSEEKAKRLLMRSENPVSEK